MYDESIEVMHAREVDTTSSEEEVVAGSMSNKFQPPSRNRHTFDSESDSNSDLERFCGTLPKNESGQSARTQSSEEQYGDNTKTTRKMDAKKSSDESKKRLDSSDNSGSDSNLESDVKLVAESRKKRGSALTVEGAYDPAQFKDLKVAPELENVFQYISKYTPQKVDIEFKLVPFIPDYIPAVGDVDGFVKVPTPSCDLKGAALPADVTAFIENLGLGVLDEPTAKQSDSALLHLQLRALSKTTSARTNVVVKTVEDPEKNPKAVEKWIRDVEELHLSKPPPTFNYTNKMPDIDSLMQEWPDAMEETLNNVGFPPAGMDCSLAEYVDLVCALFDIPVMEDTLNGRLEALHLLFSLYYAVRSSQLYADRQERKAESVTGF